ncbi:hypothetical protein PM082_022496 [Marasmius tenuissimus]|nr:hypothetical protein PM082_022496 [Marasmius tenuissimus]
MHQYRQYRCWSFISPATLEYRAVLDSGLYEDGQKELCSRAGRQSKDFDVQCHFIDTLRSNKAKLLVYEQPVHLLDILITRKCRTHFAIGEYAGFHDVNAALFLEFRGALSGLGGAVLGSPTSRMMCILSPPNPTISDVCGRRLDTISTRVLYRPHGPPVGTYELPNSLPGRLKWPSSGV